METIIKVGQNVDGIFYVDEKARKINRIEVIDAVGLEINFPGSTEGEFSYLKLEKIMKRYTKMRGDDKTLTDAVDKILKYGFFYPLKPGLYIEVERVERVP